MILLSTALATGPRIDCRTSATPRRRRGPAAARCRPQDPCCRTRSARSYSEVPARSSRCRARESRRVASMGSPPDRVPAITMPNTAIQKNSKLWNFRVTSLSMGVSAATQRIPRECRATTHWSRCPWPVPRDPAVPADSRRGWSRRGGRAGNVEQNCAATAAVDRPHINADEHEDRLFVRHREGEGGHERDAHCGREAGQPPMTMQRKTRPNRIEDGRGS